MCRRTGHPGAREKQRLASLQRVLQMRCCGHTDYSVYFKCPPTQQMLFSVKAYEATTRPYSIMLFDHIWNIRISRQKR